MQQWVLEKQYFARWSATYQLKLIRLAYFSARVLSVINYVAEQLTCLNGQINTFPSI